MGDLKFACCWWPGAIDSAVVAKAADAAGATANAGHDAANTNANGKAKGSKGHAHDANPRQLNHKLYHRAV